MPPGWLRCAAVTYPLFAPLPGWTVDPRLRPTEAVDMAGALPIVLTRVGRERPPVADTAQSLGKAKGRRTWQITALIPPVATLGTPVETPFPNPFALDRKPQFVFVHRMLSQRGAEIS